MRQPAATFLSATVKTLPDSVTGFAFSLYVKSAGATTYARSPLTSSCHGLPSVTATSVTPLFLLSATKPVAQSAHAVGPCHSCGGKSSTMDAGEAQAAAAIFM